MLIQCIFPVEVYMSLILTLLIISKPSIVLFTPVEGFADLEALTTPSGFGLLLIQSSDPGETEILAREIFDILDILELGSCEDISLYRISLNAEGYMDVAILASDYPSLPAVVVLVGCCGFLQLDPSILEAEIEDSWYLWGGGSISGICNLCTRCNP